jgi:hypothetical protein
MAQPKAARSLPGKQVPQWDSPVVPMQELSFERLAGFGRELARRERFIPGMGSSPQCFAGKAKPLSFRTFALSSGLAHNV